MTKKPNEKKDLDIHSFIHSFNHSWPMTFAFFFGCHSFLSMMMILSVCSYTNWNSQWTFQWHISLLFLYLTSEKLNSDNFRFFFNFTCIPVAVLSLVSNQNCSVKISFHVFSVSSEDMNLSFISSSLNLKQDQIVVHQKIKCKKTPFIQPSLLQCGFLLLRWLSSSTFDPF